MNCCEKRLEKLVNQVFIWNIIEENERKIDKYEEIMRKNRF